MFCWGLIRFCNATSHRFKKSGICLAYSSHVVAWECNGSLSPALDKNYLCDPKNKDDIINNINKRKGIGDIEKVIQIYSSLDSGFNGHDLLLKEMLKIPNRTHPEVLAFGEEPQILKVLGDKISFNFKPNLFHNLAKSMNLLRNNVSNFTGHRSYFFTGQLAELESALVKYSLKKLVDIGFQVISVPDLLHRSVIESCGMETRGKRSQVYSLNSDHHGSDKCLSGTSEMALAAYLMNKDLKGHKLPLRLAAVSRCFRAETSRTSEERGIYRVHQFTKVEMFGVCEPEESAELLEQFREFQVEHFAGLGLHLRVLDMPAHELGAQAHRKYDVEAWLPAKQMWAEVSSCSDCTDYQSRRLGIHVEEQHAHTVNGTACAVPRLLIALFETHQQADGSVNIPELLQPFIRGQAVVSKDNNKHIPRLTPVKRSSLKT